MPFSTWKYLLKSCSLITLTFTLGFHSSAPVGFFADAVCADPGAPVGLRSASEMRGEGGESGGGDTIPPYVENELKALLGAVLRVGMFAEPLLLSVLKTIIIRID